MDAEYQIKRNNCTCHPETCACDLYHLVDKRGYVAGFNDPTLADDICARLNHAAPPSTSTAPSNSIEFEGVNTVGTAPTDEAGERAAFEAWAGIHYRNAQRYTRAKHDAGLAAWRAALASRPVVEAGWLNIGVANNDQGVHISIMQRHADGTTTVIYSAKAPVGDSYGRAALAAKPATERES